MRKSSRPERGGSALARVLCAVSALGCAGPRDARDNAARAQAPSAKRAPLPEREVKGTPTTAAPAAPGRTPPPGATGLTLLSESTLEGFIAVIQNRGETPVQVGTALRVEPLDAQGRAPESLVIECGAPAPSCRTLVPGAELRAAA